MIPAWLDRLFPVKGDGFSLERIADEQRDGCLFVTLRLTVFDDDGSIRDVKEQQLYFLPDRHQNARGMAFIERQLAQIHEIEELETSMPHDLFSATPLLDTPLSLDALARAMKDPRTRRILEVRAEGRALLATIDPDRPTPPTLVNRELEHRIVAGEDAYAVYADWLSERGDPRGELIAIALARETSDSDELRAREQALLDEHAYAWLGDLAWSHDANVTFTWRRGFLEAVRFGGVATSWELAALSRVPATRLIRRVEISNTQYWDQDVFRTIAKAGLPANVHTLSIRTGEYDEPVDLHSAYPGLGTIRELRIEAQSIDFGDIDLPEVRSLEIVTRGLTVEDLNALVAVSLPKLERLVLWLGDVGVHDCDIELDDLDPVIEKFAGLREFGLCGRDPAPLLERLVGTPLLASLNVLDVAGGFLGTDDIAWLNEHGAAFAHLESLVLPTLGPNLEEAAKLDLPVSFSDRFIPVYE